MMTMVVYQPIPTTTTIEEEEEGGGGLFQISVGVRGKERSAYQPSFEHSLWAKQITSF